MDQTKLHRRLVDLDFGVMTQDGKILEVMTPEALRFTDSDHEAMVTLLEQASEAYYTTGEALVSDDEFDTLRDLLEVWNSDHSFLKRVGAAEISSAWLKVQHEVNVGSQEKARDAAEMRDWWADREATVG